MYDELLLKIKKQIGKICDAVELLEVNESQYSGIQLSEEIECKHMAVLQQYAEVLTLYLREKDKFLSYYAEEKGILDPIAGAISECGYGCEITNEGFIRAVLPPLLRRKSTNAGSWKKIFSSQLQAIVEPLYRAFRTADKDVKFSDAVVVFKHIKTLSAREQDYDNIEKKFVLDMFKAYFLEDDCMQMIDVFECFQQEDSNFLVVYIIPKISFADFLSLYRARAEIKFCVVKEAE